VGWHIDNDYDTDEVLIESRKMPGVHVVLFCCDCTRTLNSWAIASFLFCFCNFVFFFSPHL